MMHIGHNNMQSNYNMSNQQLPSTEGSKNHHHQRPQVAKKREKLQNGQQSTGVQYWEPQSTGVQSTGVQV